MSFELFTLFGGRAAHVEINFIEYKLSDGKWRTVEPRRIIGDDAMRNARHFASVDQNDILRFEANSHDGPATNIGAAPMLATTIKSLTNAEIGMIHIGDDGQRANSAGAEGGPLE